MEKYGRNRHATDDNIKAFVRALCVLDNKGYKHTFTIRNTLSFSMATAVMKTRLNFICTLILPVWL